MPLSAAIQNVGISARFERGGIVANVLRDNTPRTEIPVQSPFSSWGATVTEPRRGSART